MGRSDLERLSKEELIELVLRLQRPEKTSRTSSKPPATDRKEQREQAKPGGAKPGHEGHSRVISEIPMRSSSIVPTAAPAAAARSPGPSGRGRQPSERIELPEVEAGRDAASASGRALPVLRDARRRAGAGGGARHAVRPAAACGGHLPEDLSGALLRAAAGGLVRPVRAHPQPGRADEPAPACARPLPGRSRGGRLSLRRAEVVASDETGVRIEGCNAYHWVFRSPEAVVHQASPTRAPRWCGR